MKISGDSNTGDFVLAMPKLFPLPYSAVLSLIQKRLPCRGALWKELEELLPRNENFVLILAKSQLFVDC